MNIFKKTIAVSILISLAFSLFFIPIDDAHASISNWKRGVSIHPYDTTVFGSESMKQTLRDVEATGANYAILIIPYYQANRQSTEMRPGWNTPTDESLKEAIDYAHSIGLNVMLKPHLETDYIEWRGNIDPAPADRPAWFRSYTDMLLKYGRIAEDHGVEDFCIATELLRMANPDFNSTNTANWKQLIQEVRGVYNGELTYSANWDNELDKIEFWGDLDYVGISAYYNLYHAADTSPEELKKSWDAWRRGVIEPIQKKYGKDIMFTEIGYRSISDAHINPWDWSRGGQFNEVSQSNAYEALFTYWDDYPWMIGVGLWKWETNPNDGGQGDVDYTPQNKLAEETMTRLFNGSGVPDEEPEPEPEPDPNTGDPVFSAHSEGNDTSNDVGDPHVYEVAVKNTGEKTTGVIIDLEVYDENEEQVSQQFFENQTFESNQTKNFSITFTPDEGLYRIAMGAFTNDWRENYHWNNNVLTVSVSDDGDVPPPEPDPDPSQEPNPEEENLDIWWPTNGADVSGVQPFKVRLGDANLSEYQMYWQVDNGRLILMDNSNEDAPHKESQVDLTGWTWKDTGPYNINFVGKDLNGDIIKQKSVDINIYQ